MDMGITTSAFEKISQKQKDDTYEKISYSLEALVKVLQEINTTKQEVSKINEKLTMMQQTLLKHANVLNDLIIVSNNNSGDLEDLKTDISNISDKVDNVDNDIKNLHIYKYYNGENSM